MGDLEDTQYFDEDALPDVVPLDTGDFFSNDKGNESFTEGGDKLNNNSSPIVHVDNREY